MIKFTETAMGLHKNNAVEVNSPSNTSPLKTGADVEEFTFDWLLLPPRRARDERRIIFP